MSSPEGKKFASNIPKVKELRELLGFEHQSSTLSKIFNDKLRAFRREYRTRDGKSGSELHLWRSKVHQWELSRMTKTFLVANGSFFWPDTTGREDSRRLQYSQERTKIEHLLKQLIFRNNLQEFRNSKYKKKDQAHADSHGRAGDEPTEPIDLDEHDHSPLLEQFLNHRPSSTIVKSTESSVAFRPIPDAHIEPSFLGPDNTPHNLKRTSNDRDGLQSPSKRQKQQKYYQDDTYRATPQLSPGPTMAANRSSERKRRQPDLGDYVNTADAVSPTPGPTPTPKSTMKRKQRPNLVVKPNTPTDPFEDYADWSPSRSPAASTSALGYSTAPKELEEHRPVVSRAREESVNTIRAPEPTPTPAISIPSPREVVPFKIMNVVKWPGPTTEYEIWRPEGGSPLEKSLERVINEMPKKRLDVEVTGVIFSICHADDDEDNPPKWTIRRSDEEGFEFLKKRFNRIISTWLKQCAVKPLLIEMEIEPVL